MKWKKRDGMTREEEKNIDVLSDSYGNREGSKKIRRERKGGGEKTRGRLVRTRQRG